MSVKQLLCYPEVEHVGALFLFLENSIVLLLSFLTVDFAEFMIARLKNSMNTLSQ